MMDGLKMYVGIAIYNCQPNNQIVILGANIFENLGFFVQIAIGLVRCFKTVH